MRWDQAALTIPVGGIIISVRVSDAVARPPFRPDKRRLTRDEIDVLEGVITRSSALEINHQHPRAAKGLIGIAPLLQRPENSSRK